MSWREKRKIIPGGCEGVLEEIALSAQQIRMVLDPAIPTSAMIISAASCARHSDPERGNSARARE